MNAKKKSNVRIFFKKSLDKNGQYKIISKKTGKIKLIKHYVNDILNGDYIFYWDNGNIMLKGKFKNNKRVGTWVNYDSNGDLVLSEKY